MVFSKRIFRPFDNALRALRDRFHGAVDMAESRQREAGSTAYPPAQSRLFNLTRPGVGRSITCVLPSDPASVLAVVRRVGQGGGQPAASQRDFAIMGGVVEGGEGTSGEYAGEGEEGGGQEAGGAQEQEGGGAHHALVLIYPPTAAPAPVAAANR